MTRETSRAGLAAALGAYTLWGLLPFYFHTLAAVPPLAMISLRALLTVPVCLALIGWRGEWTELADALTAPRRLAALAAAALLLAANWLVYVTAIDAGKVLAASLGYYVNPLVNVLLGTVVLGERLTRWRWVAVGLAVAGVALLLGGARDTLGIALALAVSFGIYGLVRKVTPVSALTGLTVESLVLSPVALVVVAGWAHGPGVAVLTGGGLVPVLLALAGVVTAAPLLLFGIAARRLDLATLGFVQYLLPTIVFIEGLALFGERLDPLRLASFAAIWLGIAVYSWDGLRARG